MTRSAPTKINRPPGDRAPDWTTFVGFLLTALALYSLTLGHQPSVDDFALVTHNPNLRAFDSVLLFWTRDMWSSSGGAEPTDYYRPMAMLSYWVNAQLGGPTALSVRIGNVLLHGVNAHLLTRVMLRLDDRLTPPTATVFGLLWLALPVNSEAVIWLSGRFDLLAATFSLLTLLANRPGRRLASWTVPLLFAAALTSKENVLGWLPVLVLDDFLVQRRAMRSTLPKYSVIAAVVVGYLLVRWRLGLLTSSAYMLVGVAGASDSYLNLVATFARLLVIPHGFSPFHLYQPPSDAVYVLTGSVLVVLTSLVIISQSSRVGLRTAPVLALGWVWFLVSLAPAVVTGPLQGFYGDRFAYLPIMGLTVAFAGLLRAIRPLGAQRAAVLATLFGMAQGSATVYRGADWRDEESLCRAATRTDPENWYAWYMVGMRQALQWRLDEADANLLHSLSLQPAEWLYAERPVPRPPPPGPPRGSRELLLAEPGGEPG